MVDKDEEKTRLLSNNDGEGDDTLYSELHQKPIKIQYTPNDPIETGAEASESEIDDDSAVQKQDGLTTVSETFWNICNSIQGLPILTIPFAFKAGGWWALFTLIVISLASLYTSQILVKSLYERSKDGTKKRVRSSYMDIGEAFWNHGGRRLVLFIMVTELLFVATMYPILVSSLFAKSFIGAHIPVWGWALIGGAIMLPNAMLKNLSQVAWTSVITVMCSFVIFITIMTYCFTHTRVWNIGNMNHFSFQEFPASVAILVSCYLAQPFVPHIESTMKQPDKYIPTLTYSFLAMTLLNIAIGIFPILTFYPTIEKVITENLPPGLFLLLINATSLVLALTSYTLPMFTTFDVLEKSDLLCNKSVSYKEFLRIFLIAVTVLMAAFIPNFQYLLAFVGSVTGITLEFIFPALFHMKIYFFELTWWELVLDMTVVFFGSLCMAISFIVSWISMYNCFKSGFCQQ